MRNDALEGGDGSLHLGLGNEAKDTQLCQSSVVDFGPEALLLLLLGHILVAAKGVVKIESTAGDELGIECGEFTDLAALHVVLFAGNLAPLWFNENMRSDQMNQRTYKKQRNEYLGEDMLAVYNTSTFSLIHDVSI